jgi:hypothetical protein
MILLHYTGMPTPKARSTGSVAKKARSPATISSTRTAMSCSWCRRRGAHGMRARASGTAMPTSIRSSIGIEIANAGHPGGLPATRRRRSMRWSNCVATAANVGRSCRKGCLVTRMSPQDASSIRVKISLGRCCTGGGRPLGRAGADHRRPILPARRSGAAGRGAAVDAVALWLRH